MLASARLALARYKEEPHNWRPLLLTGWKVVGALVFAPKEKPKDAVADLRRAVGAETLSAAVEALGSAAARDEPGLLTEILNAVGNLTHFAAGELAEPWRLLRASRPPGGSSDGSSGRGEAGDPPAAALLAALVGAAESDRAGPSELDKALRAVNNIAAAVTAADGKSGDALWVFFKDSPSAPGSMTLLQRVREAVARMPEAAAGGRAQQGDKGSLEKVKKTLSIIVAAAGRAGNTTWSSSQEKW